MQYDIFRILTYLSLWKFWWIQISSNSSGQENRQDFQTTADFMYTCQKSEWSSSQYMHDMWIACDPLAIMVLLTGILLQISNYPISLKCCVTLLYWLYKESSRLLTHEFEVSSWWGMLLKRLLSNRIYHHHHHSCHHINGVSKTLVSN